MKKIKVMLVDDSALVRQALKDIIDEDSELEVIATASDPIYAAEKLKKAIPDVIILDVEMPRMDGLTFLEKLMVQHPIPVLLCSSLSEAGGETAMRAIDLGAVDIITKPKVGVKDFIKESKQIFCDKIKEAAQARLDKKKKVQKLKVQPKLTADVMVSKAKSKAMIQTTEKIIVVGASTGGTEAISFFLKELPGNAPGIVIVQHMPEKFTKSFAERLNKECALDVKEAENGDTILRGHVLIAPGGKHTLLKRSGAKYYVQVKNGPLVSRHRPSVDILFRTAAKYAGKNCIGVIMTGMGDDGAKGMKEMFDQGAFTIAQNEDTCTVYGMPKQAVLQGGVNEEIALNEIASMVLQKSID